MTEHTQARAFVSAAGDLLKALVQDLTSKDPELAQGMCHALENGHRMVIAMECDPAGTRVGIYTVDDYQKLRRVISVDAVPPAGAVSSHTH